VNIQDTSNSNNDYNERIFSCAGNGYKDIPSYRLRLALIKKIGNFYTVFTQYLKNKGPIEFILDDAVAKSKREGVDKKH
jgi:hypothetical protein